MNCKRCDYWNKEVEECGAFECNGIECPNLPCEEYWFFTFGSGQEHEGKYVKIRGTWAYAREEMYRRYANRWAFQYSEKEWKDMENDPERYWSMETELEVVE